MVNFREIQKTTARIVEPIIKEMDFRIYFFIYSLAFVSSFGLLPLMMYMDGVTPRQHIKFMGSFLK
jgi:hypothetical protein